MTKAQAEDLPTLPQPDGRVPMPEIFDAITSLARRLAQFEARALRACGLTPPQFFVLSQLQAGERTLASLAASAGCTRATMTGIADTLERTDLARRIPNPNARRSVLIRLTDTGRARLAAPAVERTFGECCCDTLAPEESRDLARLLARLSATLPF